MDGRGVSQDSEMMLKDFGTERLGASEGVSVGFVLVSH